MLSQKPIIFTKIKIIPYHKTLVIYLVYKIPILSYMFDIIRAQLHTRDSSHSVIVEKAFSYLLSN